MDNGGQSSVPSGDLERMLSLLRPPRFPPRRAPLPPPGADDGILQELARQGLLVVGGSRLTDTGPGASSERQRQLIERQVALQRDRAGLSELVAQDVQTRLVAAGIAAASLKGPGLSTRLYGDAGWRVSTDLDFLVARRDLSRAATVLERAGWTRADDEPVDRRGLPLLHVSLLHGTLPPVELHWRVHWLEETFAEAALDRASDGSFDLADELVMLLLFYARDGLQGLRYPTDVATWLDVFGGDLPAGATDALLRRHPELERSVRGAATMVGRLFGPHPALRPLAYRSADVRTRIALRMAAPIPAADLEDRQASTAVVNYLLAPARQALPLVLRYLVAPRASIEQRFAPASGRWPALRSAANVGSRMSRQTRALLGAFGGRDRRDRRP